MNLDKFTERRSSYNKTLEMTSLFKMTFLSRNVAASFSNVDHNLHEVEIERALEASSESE